MNAESQSNETNPVWQRLEAGRQAKAAKGGYVGHGSPAFGERSINGELVKNESEQEIIELIRRHHKSGKSLQKVADWLNSNGYTTKRGQQWKRISVKRVLDRLYGKNPKAADLEIKEIADSSRSDSPSDISAAAFQVKASDQNLNTNSSNINSNPDTEHT